MRTLPRTAILMNEFGEVALDHQLLQKMEGPMALLSGGCVCCTISGSLSPTLKNLWMARQKGDIPPFERVIIETTGVADPVPVLDNLLHDNWIRARFRLEAPQAVRVAGHGGGQDLDRHVAPDARVSRAIHLAHPAGAQRAHDLVRAERGSRSKCHACSASCSTTDWQPRGLIGPMKIARPLPHP